MHFPSQSRALPITVCQHITITQHVNLSGDVDASFLAAMRIKMLSDDEVDSIVKNGRLEGGLKFDPTNPVSPQNEFEVHHSLLMNVEHLISQYPTTLDEDMSLLRQGSLTDRAANAVAFRIEVKRILHAVALECLRNILAAFEMLAKSRGATAGAPSSLVSQFEMPTTKTMKNGGISDVEELM